MGTSEKQPGGDPRTDVGGPAPAEVDRAVAALRNFKNLGPDLQQRSATLAAGAELLLPAEDDPAVGRLLHELGTLTPGKVYLLAADRTKVSAAVLQRAADWLTLHGVRVLVLQTYGDPRAAIRVVDAEDLDR